MLPESHQEPIPCIQKIENKYIFTVNISVYILYLFISLDTDLGHHILFPAHTGSITFNVGKTHFIVPAEHYVQVDHFLIPADHFLIPVDHFLIPADHFLIPADHFIVPAHFFFQIIFIYPTLYSR